MKTLSNVPLLLATSLNWLLTISSYRIHLSDLVCYVPNPYACSHLTGDFTMYTTYSCYITAITINVTPLYIHIVHILSSCFLVWFSLSSLFPSNSPVVIWPHFIFALCYLSLDPHLILYHTLILSPYRSWSRSLTLNRIPAEQWVGQWPEYWTHQCAEQWTAQ